VITITRIVALLLLLLSSVAASRALMFQVSNPHRTDKETFHTEYGKALGQSEVGSAAWVARRVDDRDAGQDARFNIQMRVFDSRGRHRERHLTLLTLRGASKGGAVADAPPGDRLLIRLTQPNDIKGTSFLVWESPDAEDERFLYLPALARVRRMAGADSQESFVGSDFTYEDIGGREFDDYTYRMIDPDDSWMAPDGTRHPVYRLESRHKNPEVRYPRVVSLVRKDAFIVTHADVFDQGDRLRKVFDVLRLEQRDEVWTVMGMKMVNKVNRTQTELTVLAVDYNVGLTAIDFSRREFERGIP